MMITLAGAMSTAAPMPVATASGTKPMNFFKTL